MELLEEFVTARVNAAEDARRQAEREVVRQVRERGIVLRWWEAAQARRTVRAARRARSATGAVAPAVARTAEPVAAPASGSVPGLEPVPEAEVMRDLVRSTR